MLTKPTNINELQQLTDHILKVLRDNGKVKVNLNSRLKAFFGIADIYHYVKTGFRNIDISLEYFYKCSLENLINTVIHEIAHFKYSKTRKLRMMYLKNRKSLHMPYYLDSRFEDQIRKHNHTKAFKRLEEKLKNRFYTFQSHEIYESWKKGN